MINLLRRESLQIFWLAFHVLLGVAATYIPGILVIWIYLLIASTLLELASKGNDHGVIHNFLAYYLGMEILARALRLSPLVPYESGKYTMFFFLLAGLVFSRKGSKQSFAGWSILLLAIPSLFVARESFEYRDLVFNFLGIFNLGLALVYFYRTTILHEDLLRLFRLIAYSIIPLLVSVTLKTPDFQDLQFTLAASFETSGGFGSNQVSTILGLGFLLIGFCYLTNQKIFKNNWIAITLFGLFFFRGLLTFSRGGVVAGILVLLMVFVGRQLWPVTSRLKVSSFAWTILIFLGLLGISIYTNRLTDNTLLLRYQGETEATLAGSREKDMSLMTSGRLDIFLSDVSIWSENFLLGVGPGRSSEIREERGEGRVAAHVEFSRLLSEHGLMGFFISILLVAYPFVSFFRSNRNLDKLFKVCLFSFALLTSAHSAMRTNVTPFLYGLAAARLLPLQTVWMWRYFSRKRSLRVTDEPPASAEVVNQL